MTTTDQTLSRIRWLLTESSKAAGITVSVPMINRIADEMQKLMLTEGLILMWQTSLNDALRAVREDVG